MTEVQNKKQWGIADLVGKQIRGIKSSKTGTKLFLEFDENITLNLESVSKIDPVLAIKELKMVETKHQISDVTLA